MWRLTVPGILSAINGLSDKRKELPHAISVSIFFLNLKQTPKQAEQLPEAEAGAASGLSAGLGRCGAAARPLEGRRTVRSGGGGGSAEPGPRRARPSAERCGPMGRAARLSRPVRAPTGAAGPRCRPNRGSAGSGRAPAPPEVRAPRSPGGCASPSPCPCPRRSAGLRGPCRGLCRAGEGSGELDPLPHGFGRKRFPGRAVPAPRRRCQPRVRPGGSRLPLRAPRPAQRCRPPGVRGRARSGGPEAPSARRGRPGPGGRGGALADDRKLLTISTFIPPKAERGRGGGGGETGGEES